MEFKDLEGATKRKQRKAKVELNKKLEDTLISMNSPRRISRTLDLQYIKEIIELSKYIKLYSKSLLLDYKAIFEKEDKNFINICVNQIEEYVKLLKGYETLLLQEKNNSNIIKKFKIVAQEIFEVEQMLKKYSIKVWETQLTDVNKFNNGDSYSYVTYSLLMYPDLKYIEDDEQLIQEQYEKRMEMLQDKKRRFLSTSLVTDELTKLFYESHIAAIIQVDKSNYIGVHYRDAATGDSKFSKTCICEGNYDDIYTIRRDNFGNIFTGEYEPASLIATPAVIKDKQLYGENAETVSEIILDREKSIAKGILCYIYGNKFLSYSYKFANKLGEKYNLPVVDIDKTLYIHMDISEYEFDEQLEIRNGIKQYLDKKTKDEISRVCKNDFKEIANLYIKIFKLANNERILSNTEAKQIVEKIARQIINQKCDDLCL